MSAKQLRVATLGMYAASMLIWALWPVWATHFNFALAIWLSSGLGLVLSGTAQLIFAPRWSPGIFADKEIWPAFRQSLRKRKFAALPIPGVIIEDVSFLAALRFIDPTVAQSVLRFYPMAYAICLQRSGKGRFQFSKRAAIGMLTACLGAVLVIWSAATAEFGGGWNLVIGVSLVCLSAAAICTKTQELALVADVGRRLGWSVKQRRLEQSLSIVISGSRCVIAGIIALSIAAFIFEPQPLGFWVGNIVFGAVFAPSAFILARYAVFVDSDLGLGAIRSSGALATLGFATLFGGAMVSNTWLLLAGTIVLGIGSFIAATKRPGD